LVSAIAGNSVAPPHPAATLSAALGRTPSVDEVADALFAAVRSLECPRASEFILDSTVERAMERALERYRDDRWTWRR
jgi:hypothetical protein